MPAAASTLDIGTAAPFRAANALFVSLILALDPMVIYEAFRRRTSADEKRQSKTEGDIDVFREALDDRLDAEAARVDDRDSN